MKPIFSDFRKRLTFKKCRDGRWLNVLRERTLKEAVAAFWMRVNKTETCWLWTGATNPDGYGTIKYHNQKWPAHKFSFFLTHGKLTPKLFILHTCDIKACVNPSHLYEGTAKDNARDAVLRNRRNPLMGEAAPSAKLTEKQVLEIRRRYQWYKVTAIMLAREFGVTKSTVQHLIARRRWKHI